MLLSVILSQTKPVTQLLTSTRFKILIARVTYIDVAQLYNRLLDSFHKMLRNGSIHIDPNPRDWPGAITRIE